MNIEDVRRVIETGQHRRIDGVTVDLFTAGIVIAVYDKLDELNQAKLRRMSMEQAGRICLKVAIKGL